MRPRVLLVEDDISLREITALGLEDEGLLVTPESDGRRALDLFRKHEDAGEPFDIVVLDVMLPSLDGVDVCREIRRHSRVPILMVTAKTGMSDAVAGLDAGADDYVRKPVNIPEIVARVRAVLRRAGEALPGPPLSVADLEVDPTSFRVRKAGRDVPLTATEFRLLFEMARRPGQVFTREMLMHMVWSREHLGDSRMVDMAVKRLRDKVEDDPAHPLIVTTVRGVGYSVHRG